MGARFEINYPNVERVADCSQLNVEMEKFMVFLKLQESWKYNFSNERMIEVIFGLAWELWNDGEIGAIVNDFDEETYNAIEKQLDGIVKKLESVLNDFKKKTDISLYFEYDFNDDRAFFQLNWDDMIQFTPKVSTLDSMNANFEMVSYDED
jgi:hypothetical protein